jgi:hypothetical protein
MGLVEKLKEFLDTPEGQESIERFVEEQLLRDLHRQRWRDRTWERIKDNIDASIGHLLNWYGSDKYRDREYKKGYEPREALLWVLLSVAETRGEECTEEEIEMYANMFTGEIYKLGSYVIQVMHGQGSVIRIDKIEK